MATARIYSFWELQSSELAGVILEGRLSTRAPQNRGRYSHRGTTGDYEPSPPSASRAHIRAIHWRVFTDAHTSCITTGGSDNLHRGYKVGFQANVVTNYLNTCPWRDKRGALEKQKFCPGPKVKPSNHTALVGSHPVTQGCESSGILLLGTV
jgi:hypothetical protein